MAQAVHVFERTTSRTTATDTNHVAVVTVTAAEFSSAGFVNNDEVLVLAWGLIAAAGTNETKYKVTYNAADITQSSLVPTVDLGAAAIERNVAWMTRLDLATLADLTFTVASASTVDAFMERATVCVIRLSDFGTENTDWVWGKSTTSVLHTTTYAATNRAAVTIPASSGTQDWVILASFQGQAEGVATSIEAQLLVDGTVVAGDFSEEPESANEQKHWVFGTVSNLTSATHAVTFESRDSVATAVNRHVESAIIAFRKDVWEDIFYHIPGTVSVANATDVQVATITDTISANQDVVLLGGGNLDIDTIDQNGYLWVRKGGSTIIEPVTDDASGLTNVRSYDATDEPKMTILAFDAATAGVQDYDLFVHHTGGATENLLRTAFMLWGMELPSAPVDSDADGVTADGHADSGSGSFSETVQQYPLVGDGHSDGPLAEFTNEAALKEGSAGGAFDWEGTATGDTPPNTGAVTGTIGWAGSATGVSAYRGSSSGAISWTGTATGAVGHAGTGTGAISWTGTAAGVSEPEGVSTGTISWTGTANGQAPGVGVEEGRGDGTIIWVGAANGITDREGSSTGSITWTGTATGTTEREGASSGTVAWVGTSTGTSGYEGASNGTITWTGVATGESPVIDEQEGTATGAIVWDGITAVGVRTPKGVGTGTVTWAGTGVGIAEGEAVGTVTWTGVVLGGHPSGTFYVAAPVAYVPLLFDDPPPW